MADILSINELESVVKEIYGECLDPISKEQIDLMYEEGLNINNKKDTKRGLNTANLELAKTWLMQAYDLYSAGHAYFQSEDTTTDLLLAVFLAIETRMKQVAQLLLKNTYDKSLAAKINFTYVVDETVFQAYIPDILANSSANNYLNKKGASLSVNFGQASKEAKHQREQIEAIKRIDQHYTHFKEFAERVYFGSQITHHNLAKAYYAEDPEKSWPASYHNYWQKIVRQCEENGGLELEELLKLYKKSQIDQNAIYSLARKLAANVEKYGSEEGVKSGHGYNYGHVAEAYTRHLEEHHNGVVNQSNLHYLHHGETYLDFLQHMIDSLGNVAGTVSPDTAYSQVKQVKKKNGAMQLSREKFFLSGQKIINDALNYIKIILDSQTYSKEEINSAKAKLQKTLHQIIPKAKNSINSKNIKIGAFAFDSTGIIVDLKV